MKDELTRFVAAAIVLTTAGAAEEMLPRLFGAGIPVLLAAVITMASFRPLPALAAFAVAAGAFEDSLSSLPILASSCFFLLVAVVVWRWSWLRIVAALAYPAYLCWLQVILPEPFGGFLWRLLGATVIGVAMAPVVWWLSLVCGKAVPRED